MVFFNVILVFFFLYIFFFVCFKLFIYFNYTYKKTCSLLHQLLLLLLLLLLLFIPISIYLSKSSTTTTTTTTALFSLRDNNSLHLKLDTLKKRTLFSYSGNDVSCKIAKRFQKKKKKKLEEKVNQKHTHVRTHARDHPRDLAVVVVADFINLNFSFFFKKIFNSFTFVS